MKKIKQEKIILAKKLPKNLKTSYTQKQLTKKVLKKLFIPADRTFIQAQFVEDVVFTKKMQEKEAQLKLKGKKVNPFEKKFCIPVDRTYPKSEFLRLKSIGIQLKKQKGRIRFIPLIAVASFIAALVIIIAVAKDPLARFGLIQGIQKITGAKVEVKSVHVGILTSQIKISDFAAANKNNPMINTLEFKNCTVEFNLVQLLRRRFVSKDISISGMKFFTKRETSGKLAIVPKQSKNEKDKENKLKEKSLGAIEKVKQNVESLFTALNPQTIINQTLSELKSPAMAETAKKEIQDLVTRWEKAPQEFETQVSDFNAVSKRVLERNYEAIKTPQEIKAAINDIQNAIQKGEAIAQKSQTIFNDFNKDYNSAVKLSTDVQNAVSADFQFLESKVDTITSFNMDKGKQLLSDAVKVFVYDLLGKYGPTVDKIIGYAKKTKVKKPEKEKKKSRKRMAGIDVEYVKDIYPTFLLQKIGADGTGFSAYATDISNDQTKWGKPIALKASLDETIVKGKNRLHNVVATLDARENTKDSFLSADYSGFGYTLALDSDALVKNAIGMPSLNGNARLTFNLEGEENGNFKLTGLADMADVALAVKPFEPELAYRIYNNALQSIHTMNIGTNMQYTKDDVVLDITTNADKKLMQGVQAGIQAELSETKKMIKDEVSKKLRSSSGPLAEYMKKYGNLQDGLLKNQNLLGKNQKALDDKKAELEQKILGGVKKEVENQIEEKAEQAVKDLFSF